MRYPVRRGEGKRYFARAVAAYAAGPRYAGLRPSCHPFKLPCAPGGVGGYYYYYAALVLFLGLFFCPEPFADPVAAYGKVP